MVHLSRERSPRSQGLTPFRVTFRRAASPPLRSMLEEGVWYQHPEREETAIVWAQDAAGIAAVLTHHFQESWSHLRVLPDGPEGK